MGIKDLREKGRKLRSTEKPPDNVVSLAKHRSKPEPRIAPSKKGVYPHKNGKFTPEIVELILAAVRAGNYFTTAASVAGIHINTLYRWLSEGEADEDSQYHDFYVEMMVAEAEAEVSIVSVVRSAVNSDYRAGLELLSRRFPDRWSSRQKTEHTGEHGAPIEIVVSYEDEADSGS